MKQNRLCATTLFSINSSSFSFSGSSSTFVSTSFTCSDSESAATAPSPSHASAVRPGFVTGSGEAGRVRYLTARTSWLGIYADDDSHCPLAILLLPLCWSKYSSNIRLIMILLWSTVSPSLSLSHFLFHISLSLPLFPTLLCHNYLNRRFR